ncbi:SIR2 family protein [candidate division WOR-3 bacterium]|nr:SIR2 family protein [candidate division WOR-3 bacterium]
MFDDPLLNITFSVYHNKGVYALLLGSGVSRAAQIPTGWEITLDLINKVAAIKGEATNNNPELWYKEKYKEEPDYSKLLEELATTQTERRALLNAYFEPTEEDREKDMKIPTKAHTAIASLVKQGYIKVILTTNFDRLMEQALEGEGMIPDVISSEDSLKGTIPLDHSKCTIIKLHGDYKDTRIKNTISELEQYSGKMNKFLDRIFDDYGLIICGWSGQWDTALRNAILRCSNRRYVTYWAIKDELTDEAVGLIQHRKAVIFEIDSADEFFTELTEKITSLAHVEQPHPISVKIAVESVKRFLSEDKYRIQLHDFVHTAVEDTFAELSSEKFNVQSANVGKDIFELRLHQYEAAIQKIINIYITIAYYDVNQQHSVLFKNGIERVGTEIWKSVVGIFPNLQFYPALLLLYASCIVALYKQHYSVLAEMINGEYYRFDQKRKLLQKLVIRSVFYRLPKDYIPREKAATEFTPETNYIFDLLYKAIKQYIPDFKKYEEFYNIFEFLLGMIYMDVIKDAWAPRGRFIWNWRDQGRFAPISTSIIEDYIHKNTKWGDDSPIFKVGLFNGSHQRLNEIFVKYIDFLKSIKNGMI